MALFKISVKRTQIINGLHLEQGMFIEFPTQYAGNPLEYNLSHNKELIAQLFKNKYGIDLSKPNLIGTSYLLAEKIS